ncbi:MAG: hypothetical protein ACYTG1_13200 [Planctomycetota bacterium]|jgi:hypothetical protein
MTARAAAADPRTKPDPPVVAGVVSLSPARCAAPATGPPDDASDHVRAEGIATRATVALQERLRVAARMLKAFELQIGRVERGLDVLQERESEIRSQQRIVDEALETVEARIREALARFEQRLRDLAAGAPTGPPESAAGPAVPTEEARRIAARCAALRAVEDRDQVGLR